jgi:predicted deacylase
MKILHAAEVRETAIRRSVATLLNRMEKLASRSDRLFSAHLEFTDPRGVTTTLPRFLFTGPGDRSSFLRVGIFAGVHGDEESGVLAALDLIQELHANPAPALGYELFIYPVCNPWGFTRNARWLKSGADMNREFWRGSSEIEVLMLEGQLMRLAFDGVIALHTDDTSEGIYGFAKGHQLTRHVLEPALEAASSISQMAMEAPRLAASSATASPMPRAAPVITATRPARSVFAMSFPPFLAVLTGKPPLERG